MLLSSLNLDLSDNCVSENGSKYLAEGISKCVTLICLNLNLRSNRIRNMSNRILK